MYFPKLTIARIRRSICSGRPSANPTVTPEVKFKTKQIARATQTFARFLAPGRSKELSSLLPTATWFLMAGILSFNINTVLNAQEKSEREKTKSQSQQDLPPSQNLRDEGTPRSINNSIQQPQAGQSIKAFEDQENVKDLVKQILNNETAAKKFDLELKKHNAESTSELTESAKTGGAYAKFALARRIVKSDQESDQKEAANLFVEALKFFDEKQDRYAAYQVHLGILEDLPSLYDDLWNTAKVLNGNRDVEANRAKGIGILTLLSPENQPRFAKAHVWRASQILNLPSESELQTTTLVNNATKQLRYALYLEPTNLDAQIILADRILTPGRYYEEALAIYVDLFETYPAYYVKIAELKALMGRPNEASPYIERAIKQYSDLLQSDPTNVTWLRRKANANALLNNHDEAVASLIIARESLETSAQKAQLDKALCRLYLAKAMTFAEQARTDPAAQTAFLDCVIKAHETDPESQTAKTSLTRFGFSRYKEAQRALDAYDIRDEPETGSTASLTVAGTHEILNGDVHLGTMLLELAISKDPSNHEALNNLAYILMETDTTRALHLIDRALELEKKAAYIDTRQEIVKRIENSPANEQPDAKKQSPDK